MTGGIRPSVCRICQRRRVENLQESESGPCAACGGSMPVQVRFCRRCGAERGAAIAKSIVERTDCAACGALLSPGARFCRNCGAVVGAVAAAATKRPTRPSPLVLLVSLGLLAVVLSGGLGWFLWSSRDQPSTSTTKAATRAQPVASRPAPAVIEARPVTVADPAPPPGVANVPEAPQRSARRAAPARSASSERRPTRAPRAAAPAAAVKREPEPQAPRVVCVLPDGSEASLTAAACRARAGVIY